MFERFISLIGLIIFLLIGYAMSDRRRSINWRLVLWGVGLQFIFALIILKTAVGFYVFEFARVVMVGALDFADIGSQFFFGRLMSDYSIGATFAFKVLPVIIFVSAIMGVLSHFGIIQRIVLWISWVMRVTMKASGAETLLSAMFVFMGIEATTGVKDYVREMTRSELFTTMCGFMATIAGSVMAVYVGFGASAGHLLAASVMSAPAAIVMSKLMIPEVDTPKTLYDDRVIFKTNDVNAIDAAATGAYDGLKMAATIGAMMLAFIAIIGMLNHGLGFAHTSFEEITGYIFAPFAYIMGVPWQDCIKVGELLGVKTVFNEFISYQRMQGLITSGALAQRSIDITTYALCGFANFGSIAILIGGIGVIAPDRKREVATMSMKALVAGTIASFMRAAIAGMLI